MSAKRQVVATYEYRDSRNWGPPAPLGDERRLPTFPVEVFPPWLRGQVEAVADATQTPVDLAGMLALAVVGTLVAGKVELELRPGWRVPLNVYVVVAQASGEGKSPVFEEMSAPLVSLQKDRREQLRPLRHQAEAQVADLKRRREVAAKEGNVAEAALLAAEAEAVRVPPDPYWLFVQDVTSEALVSLLVAHDGRLGVLDDEGGEVFEMMLRYSAQKGKPTLGVYLRGHDASTAQSHRIGRGSEYVERATLTLGLAVQPSVIAGLADTKEFSDRGLTARFLYSTPRSRVGYRAGWPPVPEQVRGDYHEAIRRLGALKAETNERGEELAVLRLDADAVGLFEKWHMTHEPRLRPHTGDLADLADWANKLPGEVGRLAGLLHVAWHDEDPWHLVDADTVDCVLRLSYYLVEHAKAAHAAMGADRTLALARQVVGWIWAKRLNEFSRRDLHRALPTRFKKAVDTEPVLDLLVEDGYLRSEVGGHRTAGRPPSPTYIVNPTIHSTDSTQRVSGTRCVESVEPNQDEDR